MMLKRDIQLSIQELVCSPARKVAMPLLAAGLFIPAISFGQDVAPTPAPSAPAPFVTAPTIHPNPLLTAPTTQEANQAASGAAPTATQPTAMPAAGAASTADSEDTGAPWVLGADMHPYPLRFRDSLPFSALYLDLPSEQESRLLLPGKSADMADHARAVISKYFTDAIGVAAQARGRQQDALDNWLAQTDKQQHLLSTDPWQQYQFYLESTREIKQFREEVAAQAKPNINRMVEEVKLAISKIGPVVNFMPTYELRTSWYNLMVQLKEGLTLYQTQVTASDTALVTRIDDYLAKHPAVTRPTGNPPPANAPKKVAEPKQTVAPMTPVMAVQQPLKDAPTVQQKDSGGFSGGLLVVGGIFALAFVLFRKLRGGKGPAAAPAEKS
ncbi:peptide chain release factor 1 [Novimethylophilus kurashikiensis]|uniref:Peptide chain release factor 1 n=1 Tax=Novimethylophilus kurashikiensis TaxID=1825523 RepID=A0A2R5F8P3_9PROT|nr:hypothetical protein [Novimethylophilus kurashikiensis]GBG14405.1 peptide chain release factor 1 [Novimethylophilus kurashikiensis]